MRKGFTLIELMIVVAIIAVIAAIAIPNLVASRMASNETAAIAALRTYLAAQNQFHRTDFYNNGWLSYASPVVTGGGARGYVDLHALQDGTELKLIDMAFARAWSDGADPKARAGYLFDDIETNSDASDYDGSIDCGLGAAPKDFARSGRNMFVIDITGVVYQQQGTVDVEGEPFTQYPDVVSGWIAVGSGE